MYVLQPYAHRISDGADSDGDDDSMFVVYEIVGARGCKRLVLRSNVVFVNNTHSALHCCIDDQSSDDVKTFQFYCFFFFLKMERGKLL